jgi:hypothetical protein
MGGVSPVLDRSANPSGGPTAGRLRRLGFGIGDQAISSLTNVLLVVAVARQYSPQDFGAFSVGLAAIMFVVGVQRTSLGTLLAVRTDQRNVGFGSPEVRVIFGLSFAMVVFGALITAAVGVLTGAFGQIPLVYMVLVTLAPAVALQDVLRFAAVSFRRAPQAFVSDAVWLGFLLLPFAVDVLSDSVRLTATTYLALWLAGMFAGLVVLVLGLRARPTFRHAGRTVAAFRGDLARLLAEGVLTWAGALIVASATATFLSLRDTAGLRGANMLMGPLVVLLAAMTLTAVPELTSSSPGGRRKMVWWLLVGLTLPVLAWGATLTLIPHDWGRQILGESWEWTSKVVPITTLEYLVLATAFAPLAALKSVERFGAALLNQFIYLLATVIAVTVAMGAGGGIRAVAAALVVSAMVCSTSGWILWHRARGRIEGMAG